MFSIWGGDHKSPDTAKLLASVSYTSVQRWYQRFRDQLPHSDSVQLDEQVAADESFFGRLRSKQDQEIVVGVISHLNRRPGTTSRSSLPTNATT